MNTSCDSQVDFIIDMPANDPQPDISDAENAAEPLTSDGYGVSTPGGHVTSMSDVAAKIPASEGIPPTTSVRPVASPSDGAD